jgi:hypothetical protein
MWIRNSFNAKPDPTFYLNANPDPDIVNQTKPMRILADTYPCQTLSSQKLDFYMKNVFYVPMWLKGHNTYI